MSPSENPLLSVIVIIASDTTETRANASYLAGCLESLSNQTDAPSMEVIVPFFTNVDGMERIQQRFPDVIYVPANRLQQLSKVGGSRKHHHELKTLGLLRARGEIVGFLEDNERPDEFWCARTMEAHRDAFVGVGGAIENGIDRVLNWAVYYCDYGKYQNPVPYGETPYASDANVSYKRDALELIKPSWEHGFNEVTVNTALMSDVGKLALSPHVVVYQHRNALRFGSSLKERYIWGRSFGSVRCKLMSLPKRVFLALLSPLLPILVTLKMAFIAIRKRRNFGKFLKALPLITVLLASWGIGEMMGYITGQAD